MNDQIDRSDSVVVPDSNTPPTAEAVTGPVRPLSRLIGSQRNPDAYRPKPIIPVVGNEEKPKATVTYSPEGANLAGVESVADTGKPATVAPLDEDLSTLSRVGEKSLGDFPVGPGQRVEVPRLSHGKLPGDLEDEFNALFGNESLENLMCSSEALADSEVLEPETKLQAKVLAVQGDNVFLNVGAREQGVVSLKMFPPDAEPKVGDTVAVTVIRLEDGLYEVSVPLAAADVRDWSQVHEGMVVEAKITKTNSGGLECEVNRLRAFIPISQIELFRVEDTEVYVGQKLTCVVEEVNPERRNLVLSRRAMLNRERDELKVKILAELEVGQTREGLVRKIIDAGVFVDLGGVDGFIPISRLAWGRVNHPSEVLSEGTRVKVRIDRIDEEANRISLIYRDDASNPWSNIAERFQEKSMARGKVVKIMDFGAFVELMPGLEGLIHISELSHHRVNNVREVVKEGDWVDVFIMSIDAESKRMALSIKLLSPVVELDPIEGQNDTANKAGEGAASSEKGKKNSLEGVAAPIKTKQVHKGPLKGGTGSGTGGESFGLNW